MSRKINILFLGGAKRVSMARMLVSAGDELGYEVNIFSYELNNEVPVAIVGKVLLGLRWNDPKLLEHLHETVAKHEINIMIPFVDGAVGVVARYRATYQDVWAPVGSFENVEKMFDKVVSAQEFEHAGLDIPRTYKSGRPKFPLIAKPRHGSASRGIEIITDSREFKRVIANADEYVIQEYIENREEYTVDCYVSASGAVLCAVPRLRKEIIGGEVSDTITVADVEIERTSHKVISRLGLCGAVTLQFLRDVTNRRLLLMEINPRLGGGAVCSVHAGAPIPTYILSEYLQRQLVPCNDWKPGTEIVRYMQEVVFQK